MALESTWLDPEGEPSGVDAVGGGTAELPALVGSLRALEDEILGAVAASEKVLRSLEARELHTLAGYETFPELERRLVGRTPVLAPMRAAILDGRPRTGPVDVTRLTGDDRARRVKALTTIARALERLRELDVRVRANAEAVAAALQEIDVGQSYEQCGYTSFEDFLERAIAPSLALSTALLLVREETNSSARAETAYDEPPSLPRIPEEPSLPSERPRDPPSVAEDPPVEHAPPALPPAPSPAAKGVGRAAAGLAIAIVVGTAVGALAGLHPWR